MKLKFTLAAAILALTPTLALAMGCSKEHAIEQAMSCADGMVWDADKGSCTAVVTG